MKVSGSRVIADRIARWYCASVAGVSFCGVAVYANCNSYTNTISDALALAFAGHLLVFIDPRHGWLITLRPTLALQRQDYASTVLRATRGCAE